MEYHSESVSDGGESVRVSVGQRGGEPSVTLSTTLTILCRSFLSGILQPAAMLKCRMLSVTRL